MRTWSFLVGAACLGIGSLTGCGFQTPSIEPLASSQDEVGNIVNNIANHIGCEIGTAVSDVHKQFDSLFPGKGLDWLDTWAAKITLKITVEEKTAFGPGVSLKTIFPNATTTFVGQPSISSGQTFSFGIGGQFSTDATRTETLGYFVSLGLLRQRVEAGAALSKGCPIGTGPNIQGNLKFGEWLKATILPAVTPGTITDILLAGASLGAPSVTDARGEVPASAPAGSGAKGAPPAGSAAPPKPKSPPFDVISHEVNFVVIVGGNVTPTWNLVVFSANTGNSPLLGATRTRTNDVLITMGPVMKDSAGNLVPTLDVQNQHLSSQINRAPFSN